MPQHTIHLRHDGLMHRGLMRGSVTLGLEQIAHPFDFTYAETLRDGNAWRFEKGDLVEIFVDGDLLLVDGYIRRSKILRDANTHEFSVVGSAPPCDLVECTSMARPRQFANATVDTIVRKIVAPFNFTVRVVSPVGAPLGSFKIDKDDSAFDAASRAARLRGLWLRYVPGSRVIDLVTTNATQNHTRLVTGENVLRMERETNEEERFSEYHFQGRSRGTDDVSGRAIQIANVVRDPNVDRYRPFRLQMKGAEGPNDAGVRAKIERNHRAGRSEMVRCTVSGWRDQDGDLYAPNQLHVVHDLACGLDNVEMLISQARYRWDAEMKDQGWVVELELMRREALDPLAEYPAVEARSDWSNTETEWTDL